METAHLIAGVAVLATNLAAGLWGGIAWIRQQPSVGFWHALRIAQAAVVVQVGLGSILLLLGHEAPGLHYLYGVLPLAVALGAEAVRAGAAERELTGLDFDSLPPARQRLVAAAIARREAGIMSVSALIVFFLALRAAAIGGLL